MIPLPRGERALGGPGWPAPSAVAACQELFLHYPLAVTQQDCAAGAVQSMMLMKHGERAAGLFLLTRQGEELFTLGCRDGHGWVSRDIRPDEPVSRATYRVIVDGIPVPRPGTLLGWVADSQVTAFVAVRQRRPGPALGPVAVPEILVMPSAGDSDPLQWPPFAADPLSGGRLWEYVERGSVVDISPLVAEHAGCAFWVASSGSQDLACGKGCIVVPRNLLAADAEYWLPAGVYLDHWILREGITPPPARRLLALPGTVDLARILQ